MGYSEARGTLIYEKNLISKISCQTPFNYSITVLPVQLSYNHTKGEVLWDPKRRRSWVS
jgi:hypothetical protein